jgi:hypothetical protein
MDDKQVIAEEALATLKVIIRRAIVTLWTLKDPDRRYLSQGGATAWLLPVVRERSESYGWASYGFEPTPQDISQMEVVAVWLAWLRRTEGLQAIRRLIAWTLGIPTTRLGKREGVSDQTIRNRIDRSIVAIMNEFASVNLEIEEVEDPNVTHPYSMTLEKPSGQEGPVVLRKVYIYDKGFYLGSKRWRGAQEKGAELISA